MRSFAYCAKKNVCNVLEDGFYSFLCQIINDLLFSQKKIKAPLTFGHFFTNLPSVCGNSQFRCMAQSNV